MQVFKRPVTFTTKAPAWYFTASLALVLTACGGGGGGGATAPSGSLENPQSAGPQLALSAPGDLLALVKLKIAAGVKSGAAISFDTLPTVSTAVATPAPSASPAPGAASATVSSGAAAAASSDFANSRIQEAGVDEDDLVKTDGSIVYALTRGVTSYTGTGTSYVPAQIQAQSRAASGALTPAGKLTLDAGATQSGFYLAGSAGKLAVLGQKRYIANYTTASSSLAPIGGSYVKPEITLEIVAAPSSGAFTTTNRVAIDGNLVGSRLIGNTLYLVSNWTPQLSKYFPYGLGQAAASVDTLVTADLLPTVTVDGQAAKALVQDTDCYLQTANPSPYVQLSIVTAIDLTAASPSPRSQCVLGGTDGLYMAPTNVYLTSSRYYDYATSSSVPVFTGAIKTDVHKFALNGVAVTYQGSGEIPGHLGWDKNKVAYRMSEYQGDLRVVSFTGNTGMVGPLLAIAAPATSPAAISPATLTILRQGTGKTLATVGQLPNATRPAALGKPGEQVYAVQFAGSRAYVVTFRQTDPLYVLDLTLPSDPKAVGELAIPGFSDYLVPLGDKLLLGVGKDATDTGQIQGVKVALINVANPAAPSLVSSDIIGKRGSASALDYSSHGINVFQQGSTYRIALPVRVQETPSAFSSSYFDITLKGLYRYEVDSAAAAPSLVKKPTVVAGNYVGVPAASLPSNAYDLADHRSVQIGAWVYYFADGALLGSAW